MIKVIVSLFVVFAIGCESTSAQNYCNIDSCDGYPHTACLFQSRQPSPQCGKVLEVGLSAADKRKILDLHNQLRQEVARGLVRQGNPGPQPPARKMNYLQWDSELEEIAQRWANQCQMRHDSCRDVERFPVGQNLAFFWTSGDVNVVKPEKLVRDWFNEVEDFNRNDVRHFRRTNKKIGHYAQLVWGETTKIGCGAIKYNNDNHHNYYCLACNYGPSGNYLGKPVYE